MTDQYGSNDQQHEGAEGHEQDMAGENETWTGEPPVDDFHAGEEGAVVSEETEMPEDSMETTETKAKKSLALPIIAGVGGLLFLGAVLYWQFGTSSSTMPVAVAPPLSTETASAEAPAPLPPSAMDTDANSPKQPASDVAPTTGLAPVTDAPVVKPGSMPAVTSAPSAPTPAPVASPAPIPDATTVALPPKPTVLAAPAPAPAPAPATAAVVPAAVVQPPVSTVASVAKDNSIDTRLTALSTRVEDLQKSLTQAVQQLTQVSATLTANTSPTSNSAMDDRLTKLEQGLAQLQHKTSSHTYVMTDAGTEMAPRKTYSRTHVHKTAHHKTHSMQTSKVSYRSTTQTQVKPLNYAHWVLRAATPDEAWIATDATSPELRHVQVGDTLPSIGTVKAIHQNGDSWVVEGSKGTIQ